MKSVIPFTKTLEFKTKISEITSISLERPSSENDKPYTLTDKNSSDKPQNRILGLFKKQN